MGRIAVRRKNSGKRVRTYARNSNNRAAPEAPHSGKQTAPKSPKLRLAVGEPWPRGISAHVADARIASGARKDRAAEILVYAAVILLFALATWAMLAHDREMLRQIVRVDQAGLGFAGGWVGGNAVLGVLARLGNQSSHKDRNE
jgi:hypothetical protein